MINKKAEGMSINVIIIAILALVVLIVLILIFTGKMNDLIPGLKQDDCPTRGGSCVTNPDTQCSDGMISRGFGCPEYCCMRKPTT